MKRVLVTGANGFVGSHSLGLLCSGGYEVHAVDIHSPREMIPGVIWHQQDLLDSYAVADLIAQICPTHLMHFAWYSTPQKYWQSVENFRWLEASIALLRNFQSCGGQRVVMAGTCAEYDWNYGFCTETVTPCRPATPYGICKNALQEILNSYSNEVGLSNAWGRIFFLYGPREHPKRLVSSVINSLLRGETALCSHGNQIRDFLHVRDVASAFVALLESNVAGPVNIASGQPVKLKDIIMAIGEYIGANHRIEFGAIDTPLNDPPLLVGDSRRLNKELGWFPEYSLNRGIIDTIEYWQKETAI